MHFFSAERPGYSGVGFFSKKLTDELETLLGVKEFEVEGLLQMARYGRLTVVSCYFPTATASTAT